VLNVESKFLNKLSLSSRYSDGGRELGNPYTWPITTRESKQYLSKDFHTIQIKKLGTDLQYLFRHLIPVIGAKLPNYFLKPWGRRFGWSLWITATKKDS
jgi:hypothetical protein